METGLGGLEGLCTYHQRVALITSARCGKGLAGSAARQKDGLDELLDFLPALIAAILRFIMLESLSVIILTSNINSHIKAILFMGYMNTCG